MKDGLWLIMNGTETTPEEENEDHSKFVIRWDRALAIIVGILSIDPSLLYVDSDPTDPVAVWKKFVPVPEEDMG